MSSLFFHPSCPSGGGFYACDSGVNFVGCCNVNPCNDKGCSASNLKKASFDASYYGYFADQQCSSGSNWYTCRDSYPPFIGCCKSKPCDVGHPGCPESNLTAAFLSSNPRARADFLPSSISSASTSSRTTTPVFSSKTQSSISASKSSGITTSVSSSKTYSSPSISRVTLSASSSSSPSSSLNSGSATSALSISASQTESAVTTSIHPIPHKTSTGSIAGAAAGGGIFLIILISLLLFYCRRRAAASRLSSISQGTSPAENTPAMAANVEASGIFKDQTRDIYYQGAPIPCFTPANQTTNPLQDPNHPSPTPTYSPYSPTGLPKYAPPTISEIDSQPSPRLQASDGIPSPTLSSHSPYDRPYRTTVSADGFSPVPYHITTTSPTIYFPPVSPSPVSELPATELRPRVELEALESPVRLKSPEI